MYDQLLTEGLLTYGYVTKAENVNLEVTLPKGLTGIVNATNISPAYTSYLKSLVENGKKNLSQLADHTLSDLFPIGSFIVCKVISTKKGTFKLSLSPEDINCYVEQVQIKNNMILVGSVNSAEDHGYIIDIGLKDVYAFLSKENASKYNDGKQIKMGQQLQCLVVDVTRVKRNVIRSVTLSADPFKIATQMIKDPLPLPLSFICPGLQAEATIVKDEGSYLAAKFLTYNAVIPKCYCNPDGEGHEANSLVRATVLQYHPETKVIILTLRMIYSSNMSEVFPDIFIGKIIKGVVKYISSENEIYLLLSNGLWAVALPPDHTAQKRSALLKAYPVHSKHRCCVMRLVPLENLVEVCLSWKPNKLNSESSSLKDTLPADESKTKAPEIRREMKSRKNADIAKQEVEETKPPKIRKEVKSKTVVIVKEEVAETKIPEITEEEETSTKNDNVVSHEVEEAEESRSEITKLVKTSKVANLDRIGKLSRGTILKKLENGFKVLLASSGKFAVLPKRHLSDFQNHCDMLWDIYSEGDMIRVVNFKHLNKTTICSSKLSLRLTAKKGKFVQSFSNVYVGQNLIGIVKTVVDYGVFVEFPGGFLSLAVTKDITADPDINLHKYFKEGMTVSTHVYAINQKKQQLRVSLKPRRTDFDSDFQLTYFRNYFKEKNIIIDRLKSTKVCPWLFEDLHTGDLCHVTVTEVVEEGVHCTLESGTKGFIATHNRKGLTVKKNTTVAAVILDLDLLQGIVQLVASPVIVKQVMNMKEKPEEIPKNKKLKSFALLVRKEFVIVLLKMKGKAKLAYLSPKMHMNDVFNCDYHKVGDKLLVQHVRRINGKYIVKLYQPVKKIARLTKRLQETTSQPKSARIIDKGSQLLEAMDIDPESKTLESSKSRKKKTATKRKSEGNIDSDDEGTGKGPKESMAGKKCKLDSKKSIEVMPPVFFNWDNETVPPTSQNGHVSSSDDDVEMSEDKDGESSTGKLLKKKKAAKKLEKKQEEERLYEIERQRIIGEKLPETADDFDRFLLHSPNSSMLWLRYMAFHLETAEIDKARSIAERALKTILFREEQEKFNVWIAYLNLENLYGSKENLNAVLQRALQQNQPLKVYQQLVNIYTKSGKIQAARDVYDILLKRFRKEKDVWIHFAIFCFKNGFLEQGRELIEKAVQVIDKKNHVTLVSKIAQLEFKYGDIQRGTTMFENIISNYPRRTDLWSIYLDMAMSQDDKEQIRHLFQRVTNLRLSSHKIKFFYKRYLNFEEKSGDKESQEAVREKAKQYVNEQD